MKRSSASALLSLLLFACSAPAAATVALKQIEWPRNFGYRLGDTVPVTLTLDVAAGWAPDRDGLPEPGQGDRQFELRQLTVRDAPERCGNCRVYTLEWQLMKSVRAPQTLRMAPQSLRFRKDNAVAEIKVPAFEISTAPLLHWASKKDIVSSVHPGYLATEFDTRAPLLRALGWGVAGVLLLLAGLWAGGRLGGQRARPFARAWRSVRALCARSDADALQQAFRALHGACNETAGATVFASNLPDFIAHNPAFADQSEALRTAFAASRACFYGLPPQGGYDSPAALLRLLAALRDREKLRAKGPSVRQAPLSRAA
ncbi:hypothetical protein [Methyloversatilis thermotolerans]|uniref:hypothetical protein n=1 Tax=Methyloversatilis thermotolerans TaxID=1346290 RepID=UPI000378DF63|nr:hypothetical protein [Methyloversatilis thermotolerans]